MDDCQFWAGPSSRERQGTFAALPKQYAAVCYRRAADDVEFLLVLTDAGRWTFPKGRPDQGREAWETAENEAYEEAGARGSIEREPFHTYLHAKQGKKRFKRGRRELPYAKALEETIDAAVAALRTSS